MQIRGKHTSRSNNQHGSVVNQVSRTQVLVAVVALVASAVVHFVETPAALSEATYKGVLFIANGLAAVAAAVGIVRGKWSWGWLLGLIVAGGAIAGYVASRTIGLPGIPAEPDAWLEPMGVASVVAEGIFFVCFLVAYRSRRSDG